MYPLATLFPENSTTVLKHESTPAVGSSADQPFVIDDAKSEIPPSKRRRLNIAEKTPVAAPTTAVKPEESDEEHPARPNLSIVTAAMPVTTYAEQQQQQPTPQTSANSTSPTPSSSSKRSKTFSIRINWSRQVASDIIELFPSMTFTAFRHRIQQYQLTHGQLRDKPIAAMTVRPAGFRIVWDDDLGQSGWEELQGLMLESKEVSMEIEWADGGPSDV